MKIIKLLKLVFINLAVFLVLLIVVNRVAGYYLKKTSKESRADLPNYAADPAHAKAVFADYHRIKHRYEPFVAWKTLSYSGPTTHITKEGLRTHYKNGKAPDKKPIVRFFGGSTMWGEGSDDQHTIPALFNARNPQYTVYNHGQLAYNTRQELDALISVYSEGDSADIVVFYDGVNDAAFLCPDVIDKLPSHRLVPMYRDKLYVSSLAPLKELMKKLFIDDIMLLIHRWTYNPEDGRSPYDCLRTPGKAEAIAEMMISNWEMAHELVTRRNGKFLAILQPAAFISHPRTDHLDLDEELGKNFREVYRLLKEKIAARNHDWIIDLSDRFDNDDYIFIDFCHVSPNGNDIIAAEISKALQQRNP